jgi:hypothetical protein
MLIQRNIIQGILLLTLVLTIMMGAACSPAATPDPTPTPTTTPPTPTIIPTPAPFQISVLPELYKGNSIPGQKCVFLVTISDDRSIGLPVTISAAAPGAEVTVRQNTILEGQVAEVAVIPAKSSAGNDIVVTITGSRDGFSQEKTTSFKVLDKEDLRGQDAAALLPKFTSWLAANHPELGITNDTKWEGTPVSPTILIVMHYLFFSEEWEVHISWHVTIAPSDWAKIDLRHRSDQTKPSYAFEISSRSAGEQPHAIEPPATIWR